MNQNVGTVVEQEEVQNPFELAAKEAKEAPKKSSTKEYTHVRINDQGLERKLSDLVDYREQIAILKGTEGGLAGEIKDLARKEFLSLSEDRTFILRGDKASIMVQVTDRYGKVTTDQAEYLKMKYGEDVIEEEMTFGFNESILNKHLAKITEAIQLLDIPQEDRNKLLVGKHTVKVRSGAVDKIRQCENPQQAMLEIDPIISLKNYAV